MNQYIILENQEVMGFEDEQTTDLSSGKQRA